MKTDTTVQDIADAAELANLKAEVVRAELLRRHYGTTNRDWFYMLTMPIWLPAVIIGTVFITAHFFALVVYGIPYFFATGQANYSVLLALGAFALFVWKRFLNKDSGTYKGGPIPPSSGYTMT